MPKSKKGQNKDLTLGDLTNLIALEMRKRGEPVNAKLVREFLASTYTVILNQLKLNKRISFFDFGAFELTRREGKQVAINNPRTLKKALYYIEPKNMIKFVAFGRLEEAINSDFVYSKERAKKKRSFVIEKEITKILNKVVDFDEGENNGNSEV